MSPITPQHRTSLAFLQTFEHLDGDANLALRAPNCLYTISPESLNYQPNMTNDQWATHFSALQDVLVKFPVIPTEIWAEEGSNQVTISATSNAVFRDEVKSEDDLGVHWSYQGEYIFILFFDKAGRKIERIVEFGDSKKVVEVRMLIERARRNLGKRQEKATVVDA